MSEYSFGYDETGAMPDLGETESQQGPKWFREGLAKLSGQVQELKAENDRLKAAQKRGQVEDALKAKGYAPQAAGLFSGDPNQLDEWLTANGGALAKLSPEGEQPGEQAPQGPPTSTVPADGQEQMQRMQEQGTQGVAAPQGTEAELAAALRAAQTPEQFAQLMQSHGNPYDWGMPS
ncbi:hypothetical protein [Streptomyces himalayensis]|uniref:Uncharacterized protein n=1 Tax=Streptomyces himalayensis subsp. himalayensis TaxID=2756131 RepID=A0A7W0DV31_9ACTN|nr:hypothetical protein [Streptomyces himalayensis]MBA2951435.1 hypothetical protein [Streptomyces himalayensis subsp. himalayensis]